MKPHGGQRKFQLVTTVADTTTVLNSSYSSDIIIGGNAVMQVYDLGDATKYRPGRTHFIFYNNTPELVGVVNSNGSVWHRVPPRGRCICALESNAAAAGVWWSSVVRDVSPAQGLDAFDDFMGLIATTGIYGAMGWNVAKAGVGSAVASGVAACRATSGLQGVAMFSAGAVASYGLMHGPDAANSIYLGSGCRAFETSTVLYQLSVAAQEFIFRLGPGDNITGGAHTNGCYFVYDRATWGDFWVCRNINAAGNNTLVTAVVPAVSIVGVGWQKLRLEIDSVASRTDWFINNAQVSPAGGLNTRVPLPATAGVRAANLGITKTVGATVVYTFSEYARVQSFPTALR